MQPNNTHSRFQATVLCPLLAEKAPLWGFIILPLDASDKLPRRGRTTIQGTLNQYPFQATLEPDGNLSHWLRVDTDLLQASGVSIGDTVWLEIMALDTEPEPELPMDLQQALTNYPAAKAVWDATTTLARLDWIHWVTSAKQTKTRNKRIKDACEMLSAGKKRVCCFDPSGFYSKALRAPLIKQ